VIELTDLGKRWGDAIAVERLSLRVERGELFVLVGGSGSGKTTTLKMINRLVEPTSGSVRIAGTSSANASATASSRSASSRT
jgi:osmoprotectant transport system ATP-binding protein